MCIGGGNKTVQQAPPSPPPPPPVLEQAAPAVASPTQSDTDAGNAQGTKKYRTSLTIATPGANVGSTTSNNSGIGISM